MEVPFGAPGHVKRKAQGRLKDGPKGKSRKSSEEAAFSQEDTANPPGAALVELERLADKTWKQWGPYLSERQWGTVREDYSTDGNCWSHLPHCQAAYRAYQWGEDGLLGICNAEGSLCMALSLWNGQDPILKERLFGLTGPEGNHGEDVKELYYYLDSSPTHSYMKGLYRYPMVAFPYDQLCSEASTRGPSEPEFEITDTGIFEGNEYWDVEVEYAKASPCGIAVRYTVHNRSTHPATLHLIPTVWFRNTWSWSSEQPETCRKRIYADDENSFSAKCCFNVGHFGMSNGFKAFPSLHRDVKPSLKFVKNDTNLLRMVGHAAGEPCKKDGIHQYVIQGNEQAIDNKQGTKCAAVYQLHVEAGSSEVVSCQLTESVSWNEDFDVEDVFCKRRQETDEFFQQHCPLTSNPSLSEEQRHVARQAVAGLLWSKQYYNYNVRQWIAESCNPQTRINQSWKNMRCHDILSMPDKWEFPWFATWDLAFHMIPMADVDLEFCKGQLLLLLSDRYMHPNGQLPAYEFNFSDTNPPVHAWACLEVYKKGKAQGNGDLIFLRKCFHRLLINYTWWLNKIAIPGHPFLFGGGFLGMDNISIFDRSKLPKGVTMMQADGTGWMAFYAVCMLEITLELMTVEPSLEDIAMRFWSQYKNIVDALQDLWGGPSGDFLYDYFMIDGKTHCIPLKSLVGIVPLFAVTCISMQTLNRHPNLKNAALKTLQYSQKTGKYAGWEQVENALVLSPVPSSKLGLVINTLFNEKEFLSPYGIRSLSKVYSEPLSMTVDGKAYTTEYCPGESNSDMFGGNSNWRGPIWIPMNYLIARTLRKMGKYMTVKVSMASVPGVKEEKLSLEEASQEIADRVSSIFLPNKDGVRPVHGGVAKYASDPHWRDQVLFYEYYHAETGKGLGASHQTGWSALAANFMNWKNEKLE